MHYKGAPPVEPQFDFSYDGVMRSVEESLARLKLDRVDILHIHDPDDHYDAALSGAYRALAQLRREGVVGAIGAGMNQWQMLQRFAEAADFDCFLLAGRYTLLDRSAQESFLPLCALRSRSRSSPAASTTAASSPIRGSARSTTTTTLPPDWSRRRCGSTPSAERTACRSRPRPSSFRSRIRRSARVLTGARSDAELRENVAMFETPIAPDLWNALRDRGLIRVSAKFRGARKVR